MCLGENELCHVENDPWEMTNEEHEDDTDKNSGKIDLIVRGTVLPLLGMGIPDIIMHRIICILDIIF